MKCRQARRQDPIIIGQQNMHDRSILESPALPSIDPFSVEFYHRGMGGHPRRMTRDQVREVDRRAIEEFGIPGVVLMENAGRAATEVALKMLSESGGKSVLIACGTGNLSLIHI